MVPSGLHRPRPVSPCRSRRSLVVPALPAVVAVPTAQGSVSNYCFAPGKLGGSGGLVDIA